MTTTPTTQRTRPKKMNSSREKVVIMMKKKGRERMRNTTHNIRNMFLKQKLKGEEAGTQLEQTTPQCSDKTTSTVRTTTGVRPQRGGETTPTPVVCNTPNNTDECRIREDGLLCLSHNCVVKRIKVTSKRWNWNKKRKCYGWKSFKVDRFICMERRAGSTRHRTTLQILMTQNPVWVIWERLGEEETDKKLGDFCLILLRMWGVKVDCQQWISESWRLI